MRAVRVRSAAIGERSDDDGRSGRIDDDRPPLVGAGHGEERAAAIGSGQALPDRAESPRGGGGLLRGRPRGASRLSAGTADPAGGGRDRRRARDGRRDESSPVLVVTRDDHLLDVILAAAASCGSEPVVAREIPQIRRIWARAPLVLVGADMAPRVAGMGLLVRTDVHIVGDDSDSAAAWSVPLGASALVLPEHSGYLPALLTRAQGGRTASALTVEVMSGSGGVGGSTFAGALAQRCAEGGLSSALVDLDPCSGGADLLFGAEHEPGWRWCDLASASGTVGDLNGRLPQMCGVDLLATARGRGESVQGLPGPAAVRAVLDALARSHQVVVLDGPVPAELPGSENAVRLIVVAAEVRSVMSARARAAHHGWQDAQVVVRSGRDFPLAPGAVADSLGLPVAGVIGTDPRLPAASRVGEPPARAARRRYVRQVDALIEAVIADA